MSGETLSVVYDGPALREGSMPVHDLRSEYTVPEVLEHTRGPEQLALPRAS